MKNKKAIKALLLIAVALILSLPISALLNEPAGAAGTNSTIESSGDYVFFVIENTKTPLAAIPTVSHHNYTAFFVMLTFVSIVFLGYCLWCVTLRHNALVLAQKLPVDYRLSLKNTNAFLHPVSSYQIVKDAEYNVAQKYVYYR